MDYVSKNYKEIGGKFHPEDLWICEVARPFLEKEGMIFAPEEVAKRFSKEGNDRGVIWNREFGWHGLNYTDISKWLDENPEYKDIFVQKFTDFTEFIRKYLTYDGTFHVLHCKPIQIDHYKKLSSGEKNYDCRIDLDLNDLDEIKPGHKIIYTPFRISVEQVGVKTFERVVSKVEKSSSKKALLVAHPDIKITNSFNLPKWKQRAINFLGNIIFLNSKSYTLFWFSSSAH